LGNGAAETCPTETENQFFVEYALAGASFNEAIFPLGDEMILFEADPSLFQNAVWRGRVQRHIAGLKSSARELRGLSAPDRLRELGREIELFAGHVVNFASALERWLRSGRDADLNSALLANDLGMQSLLRIPFLISSHCK